MRLLTLTAIALVLSGCSRLDRDGDGVSPFDGDCDDSNAEVLPGAPELCGDGIDNDCDGFTEPLMATFYPDADGDGQSEGNEDEGVRDCIAPEGYTTSIGDCDDTQATVYAGASEVCDTLDNDCDGETDEGVDLESWADADGDGFGNRNAPLRSCEIPSDHVTNTDDCNDNNPDVNPDIEEICNLIDDDCDGSIDEQLTKTWYPDFDGDGFGDPGTNLSGCSPGDDWVLDKTDCDDDDAAVNTDATETCNLIDDDCDGTVDNGFSNVWYVDADGDGAGDDETAVTTCTPDDGLVDVGGDCDDTLDRLITCDSTEDLDGDGFSEEDGDCDETDATINPDGTDDSTDTFDQDCDGIDGPDADGDGFADAVTGGDDCDDTTADINPGATEACNRLDDDCDGTVDNGVTTLWYADVDGDGFGDPATEVDTCDPDDGLVPQPDDCDDAVAEINPTATEVCDDIDQDCDGDVANGFTTTWFSDVDEDGFGDPATEVTTCDPDDTQVDDNTDCDDAAAEVYPGATELCDDIDQDCDGDTTNGFTTTWFSDVDDDGFGDPSTEVTTCDPDDTLVDDGTDCDDTLAEVNPGATELCDDIDQDCDGDVANGFTTVWYSDLDEDGFGDPATEVTTCDPDDTQVDNDGDCDDAVAELNPDGVEICDGIDQDCNLINECDLLGTPTPTTSLALDSTNLVSGAMVANVDTAALVLSDLATGDLWLYDDISTVTDPSTDFTARVQTTAVIDPTHMLTGQLNAGDDLDLVVVGDARAQVYPGPFTGDALASGDYGWDLTEAPIGAALGDLDGDDLIDLVLLDAIGGSIVAGPLDSAAGPDTPDLTLIDGANDWIPSGVAVLDLDGDGSDDLALLGAQVLLLGPLVEGANDISTGTALPIGGRPSSPWANSFDVYDLDNDGTHDLLLAGDGSGVAGAVHWSTDAPATLLTYDSTVDDAPHGVDLVRAGDLDGDGSADVLFGSGTGSVSLFYGPFPPSLDATQPGGSLTVDGSGGLGTTAVIGDLSASGRDSLLLFGDRDSEGTLSWWNTSP